MGDHPYPTPNRHGQREDRVKKQANWGLMALVVTIVLGWTSQVHAGGYDTPMLYTARHQGMGGTAISYVNDGSAFYHNPAGIGAYDTGNILLGVGVLLGGLNASPAPMARSIDSDLTVAPLPLLGGGARLFNTNAGGENNFALVIGAGVFPVASAGGKYTYDTGTGTILEDATTLIFIEAAPGIGLALENTPVGDFRLGATYRLTYVSLSRSRTPQGLDPTLDISPNGFNAEGFRIGFQWQPIPEIQFGYTYRHRIDTPISSDSGTFQPIGELDSVETTFTLPGRMGWGIRGDYMNVGLAVDLEYAMNSQNTSAVFTGTQGATSVDLVNVSRWTDALTLRVGAEYTIDVGDERKIQPRLGFTFDDKTSSTMWPSAFGTPPGATYIVSAGAGYDAGKWQMNLAYAYRWGSAAVSAEDIAAGDAIESCNFCGYPGEPDYSIGLHGIYLDFSYDFR